MLLVYVGLLLFSVTWATLEETSKANIALHHVDETKHQEPAPTEIQESKKQLALFEANGNDQSSKSSMLPAKRKTLSEDYDASHQGHTGSNLRMPTAPESTGDSGTEGGDHALGHLQEREEFGAVLRSNVQPMERPAMDADLWMGKPLAKEPRDALSTVLAGVEHSHPIRRSTHYLKQLSKNLKIPSDFEGSGSPDLQERGDNDISLFSGDGQPFQDIPGQGGAGGPSLESVASETDAGTAEMVNSHTSGLGSNEIPGRGGHRGQAIGTRDRTAQEAGAGAAAGPGESSNDIIGSTNFRDLPGKEGNRVDGGSQNAHGGKIEFRYPQVPSKEKMREGSHDNTQSANYNEIPKSSRKDTEASNKNEEQSFPSKGKSRGLNNGIKNEIDSPSGSSNEGNIIALGRKGHYVPHRRNNSPRSKGMSQWRRSWRYRKPHSNRSPPKREDSSESSDSGSSSESDGD